MTRTVEHDPVQYVEGYPAPPWADEHMLDVNFLVWSWGSGISVPIKPAGEAEMDAETDTIEPSMSRHDEIEFDGQGCGIRRGGTYIFVADDVEVTPDGARLLAQALVELADLADGVR